MLVGPIRDDRTPRTAPLRPRGTAAPADDEVAAQARDFNHMLAERAELQRETNAIGDLILQQAKKDDELMRAWIKLI